MFACCTFVIVPLKQRLYLRVIVNHYFALCTVLTSVALLCTDYVTHSINASNCIPVFTHLVVYMRYWIIIITVVCHHITVWTVVQTVLTATFNSYGNRQISTPTQSIPLSRSTKKSAQLITSARRPPIGVKGGNSGTLSYFSNCAYNSGFMQLRYGALASSIILLWSNALYVCLLATNIFLLRIL